MNIRIRICKIKMHFDRDLLAFFMTKASKKKRGPAEDREKNMHPFFCAPPRCLTVIMYTTNRLEPEAIADYEKVHVYSFYPPLVGG